MQVVRKSAIRHWVIIKIKKGLHFEREKKRGLSQANFSEQPHS